MRRVFIGLYFLMLISRQVVAASISYELNEVQTFIKALYAVPVNTFEFNEIGGKHSPELVRKKIYPMFFTQDILQTLNRPAFVEGEGSIRHPSLASEELSGISEAHPTESPKIRLPIVTGNSAYVDVYPDNGRTIYFLTKTPDGWRIKNTASYNVWPPFNDGKCWEPFYLVKPTPEQQALETKECIKFRQSQLPK